MGNQLLKDWIFCMEKTLILQFFEYFYLKLKTEIELIFTTISCICDRISHEIFNVFETNKY
jgi:hypothetical protein